ncbi:MAG: hypothetical protein GY896_23690 [Gammaproteobacteria bacterium]|nr:hypothetical protein [Gammaproteobacteria bacterium]
MSLKDARAYLLNLPQQLDDYLDDDYRKGLNSLLDKFEEFFNVVASVNLRTSENRKIEPGEATEISDYGFVLLLKLVDLMERLDLPHKRKEIEQISLVVARWTISYNGTINYLEPVVNAIAQLANLMQEKRALLALSDLIADIVEHCSLDLKKDQQDAEEMRPWRLLHVNRGIVATRTHDLDVMKQAFDDFLIYLPQDASGFFAEGMKEMDALDYPPHVRKVMESYFNQKPSVRLH